MKEPKECEKRKNGNSHVWKKSGISKELCYWCFLSKDIYDERTRLKAKVMDAVDVELNHKMDVICKYPHGTTREKLKSAIEKVFEG